MPRRLRQPKTRLTLTVAEMAGRAKWGGILPDMPELTEGQWAAWCERLRDMGIEPSGDNNVDVARFREAMKGTA